jgi:glycosyltransferase involved in cell wall biosynthesis
VRGLLSDCRVFISFAFCFHHVVSEQKLSVSVLIPCFNDAATIAAAITSVLSQGGPLSEIVVVDDGSTDFSLSIAYGFGPKVRVITGPNQGVSAARNRGIAQSGGKWLIFLDGDDLLLPNTLSRRLAAAQATEADVVICDWRDFVEDGPDPKKGPVRSVDLDALAADPELACAAKFWAPPAALMYRRELVDTIGGFRLDLPVIEDARFLFDVARHGARFARRPHVGALYRVRPDSASRRDPARFWRSVLLNGRQIEALWRTGGSLTAARRAALADIYNSAAHGLFRSRDPQFREALAAARASGLPIGRRNRLAELLSDVSGQPAAARLAELWTMSRRALRRAGQTGALMCTGRED